MRTRLKFLLLYFIGWVLFFESIRLLFVTYHYSKTSSVPGAEILKSFWYGLRMDLSVAAYILVPVCLFVLLSLFLPLFRRTIIYKIYSVAILFVACLIVLADLEMYNAWGFRIDAGPLKFLTTPREAIASISHLPLVWISILFIIGFSALAFLLCRWINWIFFKNIPSSKIATAFVVLLLAASLMLPIRGGWQPAPLNQSAVYFSSHQFANHAAINAAWNFLHSLKSKANVTRNPYTYFSKEESRAIVDSLYQAEGKTAKWINNSDSVAPNVIVVIWESFIGKAVDLQYEGIEVTPRFNALKKEGIYFSQLYASGDRTNKGVPAILSGYPAMPNTTIIHNPAKSAKLSSLTQFFNQNGYSSSFIYGGEPEFANIKSYLLHTGFQKIIGRDDFAEKDMNSKWGAHDGVVMERLMQELAQQRSPFFTTWLTLSSHEPFETPEDPVIKGKDKTALFLNSIRYTDKVLGNFIDACKQQPWWQNTILVILGDHGHPLPETGFKADDFRIPMLWLGGALASKAADITEPASQLDLAATLVGQLGGDISFPFSKNLADSSIHRWAFFNFNDGFGLVSKEGVLVFDNTGKREVARKGNITEKEIRAGQALQQVTFQDFMEK